LRRIIPAFIVVFLALSVAKAQTQEAAAVSPETIPTATRSQADCTGFIAEGAVPHDLFVVGGADDDFHSVARQWVTGESVFISGPKGEGGIPVGAEYNVVRPAKELFRTMHYQGEGSELRKLGRPYEDVAQVRVTHVSPQGVVAEVTFGCSSVQHGDILLPFQPHAAPEYTVSKPLDHFLPSDPTKVQGRITASRNNFGFFGHDTVVYLNLGQSSGMRPGMRFRVYKVLQPEATGAIARQRTPEETIGEAIVLSVEGKSSVAMIVSSYREISAGDYVEEE
jgi:hypothetical protein